MEIRNVSLKDFSSLRIGGKGKLVEVRSAEEMREAVMRAKASGLRPHILGEGTNSYFGEDLSDFLFVKMDIRGVDIEENDEEVILVLGGGEIWDDIVRLAVDKGWWGIENLSYIPGTVGAAPVQNIGAYGAELSNVFLSIVALDTETMEEKTLTKEDCRFGYRDSIFKYPTSPDGFAGHSEKRYIILSVTLKLYKEPHPVLFYKPLDSLLAETATPRQVRDLVAKTRSSKLPYWQEHPNAGSFFKNAVVDIAAADLLRPLYPDMPLIQVTNGYKIPTAWLVDHVAGMKGVREGDLGTWPAQPLVIVNYGNATADDVDAFADMIREKINEKTGIVLDQEVNRVG